MGAQLGHVRRLNKTCASAIYACLLVVLSCGPWDSQAAEPADSDGQYLGGTTSVGSDLEISDEIDRAKPCNLTRWRDDLERLVGAERRRETFDWRLRLTWALRSRSPR